MQPNPVLQKLGFAADDRVAIIHTDDIGMCFSSVSAFAELWDFGLITSGAVMVPCPWFLKAAEYARANPQADLGVHVTLTCEYKTYRWGPISTRDPKSGMIDEEGYFYHRSAPVGRYGDPDSVQSEIQAQVERASAMGMQPTHMDTHMGAVGSARLIPAYLKVALTHRLPPLMVRLDPQGWMAAGLDAESAVMAAGLVQQFESLGLPLLDSIRGLDLRTPDHRLEQAKQAFASLKPGITHFIIHPSKDTPELHEITPDWRGRVADYETFRSEELRQYIRSLGVQLIGYRTLQEQMPDPASLLALPL